MDIGKPSVNMTLLSIPKGDRFSKNLSCLCNPVDPPCCFTVFDSPEAASDALDEIEGRIFTSSGGISISNSTLSISALATAGLLGELRIHTCVCQNSQWIGCAISRCYTAGSRNLSFDIFLQDVKWEVILQCVVAC